MLDIITLADGSTLDVSRFPLPEGLPDGVVNRAQLAVAFRVSENTVTKWVGQGMPAQSEGQNGVAWEFRLSHCYAWRMARDQAARDARDRGDQLAQQAAMAFLNLSGEEVAERGHLTADEVRKWAEAEYQRNRVDEQRRDLLRRGPVQEMLDDLVSMVRTTIATLPDYCEREFGLAPADVAKLEARGDQLLFEMRQRIERELLGPAEVIDFAASRQQDEMSF